MVQWEIVVNNFLILVSVNRAVALASPSPVLQAAPSVLLALRRAVQATALHRRQRTESLETAQDNYHMVLHVHQLATRGIRSVDCHAAHMERLHQHLVFQAHVMLLSHQQMARLEIVLLSSDMVKSVHQNVTNDIGSAAKPPAHLVS